MPEGIDLAPVVFGAVAAAFALLIGLVVRRMAKGDLHETKVLEAPEPEEDRALTEEALGREVAEERPKEEKKPEEPAPESTEAAMKRGLAKTRKGFMARINGILFGGRQLDPALVDELEEVLVTSDIGIHTAERLLGDLRNELGKKEIGEPAVVQKRLEQKILEILRIPSPPLPVSGKPSVIMVIGVNGVGKTTTIGKIAARLAREGKQVILAAGDTFRAAAVEQLEIWADRSGAKLIRGADKADPSSVMFEAIKAGEANGADVVIADTAGRLHTKVNLMEELKKVRRVMEKARAGAPDEVLLVLDATMGQNAIAQAQQFTSAVQVSSIALTKLDGTAKGGVVVAICDQLQLPVRFVGIGEGIDDLRDFDPEAFVRALFAGDGAESAGAGVDRQEGRP